MKKCVALQDNYKKRVYKYEFQGGGGGGSYVDKSAVSNAKIVTGNTRVLVHLPFMSVSVGCGCNLF